MAKSSGFSAGQKALQAMGVATAPSSPITQQKSNTSGQTPGQNALKAAGISGYQQSSTPQTGYGSSSTSREDEIYKALTAGMQQNQASSTEPSFVDWAGRQDLVSKYNQLQESTGFVTTVEQSNELEAQMKAIREQIDAGDIKFGNGLQSFGAADRAKNVFEGATNQYLSGLVNNAAVLVQHQGDTVDYAMRNGEFADWLDENGYELSENSLQGGETIRQAARDYLEPAADYLADTGAQNIEAAKGGLGTFGQGAVDLATNAIQMGYDVGMGKLLGGGPAARKAAMFIRTLGSAAQEARRDETASTTLGQEALYGITRGGIEVATEMMFDGLAGIMGAGAADEVVEKVVSKLAKSNAGRTALRGLIETGGEGFEEVVSDLLEPYAKMIYNGKGLKETFKEGYDVSQLLYDFIIGAAMGGLGQVGSVATGQHAAKNLALELQDARAAAFNQRYGLDEAMDALMGTSRNGQSGFNGRWGLQNNTQAAAQQNPVAPSVTGLIKNAPDPNNKAQKYVADRLGALDEAAAESIASDNRYVSAFEDLTDLPLSGTPEQIAQQILDYAQEATGAQEAVGDESVPPTPQTASTEPPAALNSNQSETAPQETAEQATNPATEALLNPVVPGQEEARSQLPPKPLRSGADMALWALGLDQQNQQDILENQGVDVDASDFDDEAAIAPSIQQQVPVEQNAPGNESDLPFYFDGDTMGENDDGGTIYEGKQSDAGTGDVLGRGNGQTDQGGQLRNDAGRVSQDVDESGRGMEDKAGRSEKQTTRDNFGQSARILKDKEHNEVQKKVVAELKKRTDANVYYVADTKGKQVGFTDSKGNIYISANMRTSYISGIATGIHELVHSRFIKALGNNSNMHHQAAAIADRAFSGLSSDQLFGIYEQYAKAYYTNYYGSAPTNPSDTTTSFFSDSRFRDYVKHEALASFAGGSTIRFDENFPVDVDVVQESARRALSDSEWFNPEDFDDMPLASEVEAIKQEAKEAAAQQGQNQADIGGISETGEPDNPAGEYDDFAGDYRVGDNQQSTKPADGDEALNARDQEIDELEKRDKRREEDEYQEKRWGDKHSIDNAKAWEQQERQRAKAEQEQTTGPKYAVREQLGSEAHDAVNRAARSLAKDTSEPIKGDESKRKLSKHYAKAQGVITTMSDFAEGNASFSDLVEEYGKLEDTAFYDKSTHDQLKAVKEMLDTEEKQWQHVVEDGRFVDNTGKTGGQYKAETAKAVAKAVQQINHRVKRVGEVGVKPRAELNGDIRAGAKGRAKTTTKLIEKFTGRQLRPDVMFKKLGGFVKGSAPYQLAEKHMQAIKDKQNQKQAALEYFISATKMKGYEDFAKGKTIIKNPVPGHGDSQMSLNTALGLLKTLETNGAIEHIIKNAEKGGVQFAASEKELYSGAHNNGFGDKASYGQTLSMLSDKTIERLANAKSGKEIAHARATAQLELEALRDNLKAEVMKNEVAKAMYNASFNCMRYLGMNMNDASQTMWGVDFATEGRNYYPLEIASQGKVRELLNDPRGGLKNMGIVQERTGASGALRIRPFTDVMSHYIEQSTDWSAFSVLSDELELLSRNNGGGDIGLTATIGNEYGKFYADWLDNYVKDLNGTREGGVQFSGLRSDLASAALTLNGGVALKQSPSYFDAAGIIDMGILVKHSPGLFKTAKSFENNPLIQEVEMRTGMLGQRKMGYNAVEVGEATESARGLSSKVNKLLPNWMTNWITKTDVRTTSNLMLACADQVMAESADGRGPKVEKGSEEYYRAIADKFEQVILQSQPVYTKQARADYMRNPSDAIRTLAMFRTQQTQNFNQLVTAIGEYQNASAKDKATAGKQLVTVASGQIIASAMFSVLSAVARAGLHKFDDFKDDEGWSEEKIAKRLGLNMLGSVAGTVWFGNVLASFAVDALSGGNTSEFQGLDDNVMSMITDAATSVISWFGDKKDLVKIKNLVLNVSQAFGIPARNAYNMLNSVVMFGLDRSRAVNGGAVWDTGKSSDFVKMINDYNEQDDKKRAKTTFDVAMRAKAVGDEARYNALMSTLDYENDDVVEAIKTSARQQFALGEIDIATYKQILTKWGKMTASDAQAYAEGQEEKRELAELMENDAVAQLDQQISDAKDRADEYDSSRDYAAMDLIIGALLDDADTDKLVRAKTSKGFRTSYEAMRQAGMTPKEVSTTYKAMDGDNNGSLKQDELVEYYLANPSMEYIIKQIWATKGWKTSWETKRDKVK